MRVSRGFLLPGVIALMAAGGALVVNGFDHEEHAGLFPRCASCHAGMDEPGESVWPTAVECASCHDGTVEDTVTWAPPTMPRVSNLQFEHAEHQQAVAEESADSTVTCATCHTEAGGEGGGARMTVVATAPDECLACHQITTDHYSAAPEECSTCHVTLAEAGGLSVTTIAAFPAPTDHESVDFAGPGHGTAARPDGASYAVAASCATCHARDFCLQCHVDAPEQETIQALALDPRSLAIVATLTAPASHEAVGYYRGHGPEATDKPATCQSCHTQESCTECHVTRPVELMAMHAAAPDRGVGAKVFRESPETHGQDFSLIHADPASSAPETCATCHTRTECLECHRPDPGYADGGFHPSGYLSLHPVSAYNQETQCADCHNTNQFCASCHVNAGVVATGPLKAGYHDAQEFFSLGHGQSARQNLESCVSCHAERDCLVCHSAIGGRRFNPHGPDFDAEKMKSKNPQMCTACHGFAIPSSQP